MPGRGYDVRGMVMARESLTLEHLRELTQRRLARREAYISRAEADVARLRAELEEIAIAARVLSRLSETTTRPRNTEGRAVADPGTRRRPELLPTLTEMIETTLRDAAARGIEEMGPADAANQIRNQWGPNIKTPNVNVRMWKMADIRRLVRNAERQTYSLPPDEAPSGGSGDSSPGASPFQPNAQGEEPGGGT